MTKQVQRRRGSSTQHTGFTGADGEISVNTTNKSVHVHDGATAGGFEAARADLDNVDSTANLSINNLTVTGTVDGRDVAADGTKLDGIEALADVTDATNVAAAGAAMLTGAAFTGDLTFGDNDKAVFGAGSDLQIYHSSGASHIDDVGTGDFKISTDGAGIYLNKGGSESMASFLTDGAVTLFYNNAAKLATTSTGVDVTGTVTADGLTVDTSDQVIINHSGDGGGIRIDSTNNTNTGSLRFGDVADNYIGAVEYNHSTDALSFYANNATRMTISSSGSVGIGVVPETTYVQKTTLRLSSTASLIAGTSFYPYPYYIANNLNYDASDNLKYIASSGGALLSVNAHTGGSFSFYTAPAGTAGATASLTERFRIATNGSVGIGTASPSRLLSLNSSNASIDFSNGTWKNEIINSSGQMEFRADHTNAAAASLMSFSVDGSEAARLDASGNLLIGKTTLDYESTAGFILRNDGFINASRSNGNVTDFNRLGSDGDVVRISQDGTTIGNITVSGNFLVFGAGVNTGLKYGSDIVSPARTDNGNDRDNVIDLGKSGSRFNDAFITNGVTTGSDANEKQQIALLTDAEIRAAKSISAGFKTFKWNDAVEAKGDNARTHTGVIAQEVQAALEAEGLDAGNYAFWMSDTWWETQTEVPAVEAVEAVDAVYEDVVIPAVEEELDEDGNVIVEAQAERTEQRLVSEAIEAVEAVDAYTRTDTYDTAEEAPEGATERTRMGIRYPELLAFVGAATEQRLANIETRLAALEAN